MKKLKNKLTPEEISNDIDQLLSYISKVSDIDPEKSNIDKIEEEVKTLEKNFKEKYKEYIIKGNLDSKK